jgi:hypothetical protein
MSGDRKSLNDAQGGALPAESLPVTAGAPSAAPVHPQLIDPQLEVALADAIRRLEQVIDDETSALRTRRPIDLDGLVRRKSQGLLELTRLSRLLVGRVASGDLRPDLARLSGKLERSRELLRLRLTAAQEVAGLVADAMRAAESDGTYSATVVAPGVRRR